jgi:hypothetical protein
MSQREEYSPRSQSNNYFLPNYAAHTQQQLSSLCKARGLSEMGHKHQLVQRLVYKDLDNMNRNLLDKEWCPTGVPFMKEYAELKECTMQGAWQFYTEKTKYLRRRMGETQGKLKG